jgi:hypothetical protein
MMFLVGWVFSKCGVLNDQYHDILLLDIEDSEETFTLGGV